MVDPLTSRSYTQAPKEEGLEPKRKYIFSGFFSLIEMESCCKLAGEQALRAKKSSSCK